MCSLLLYLSSNHIRISTDGALEWCGMRGTVLRHTRETDAWLSASVLARGCRPDAHCSAALVSALKGESALWTAASSNSLWSTLYHASPPNAMDASQKKKIISDAIRTIPDFPKAGIQFQDITTVLLNPDAFKYTIDLLADRYRAMNVDAVAGGLWVAGWRTCGP
jgi:hypothetical protein